MTLPPEKIGDKNQRYVVRTYKWPNPDKEWQDAGYCNTEEDARKMQEAFWNCPGCKGVQIIDRDDIAD
jgi:hypothetical protein